MISPGSTLDTSFTFSFVIDGETRATRFKDLLTRPTIVSVYMRNNTGSCDKQNASLATLAAEVDKRGYNLIAISRDTCTSHTKYAAKLGLTYVLASDPDDLFSKAADAIVEKSMYGKKYTGPARAAYVLDKKGVVKAVIEKVDSANHADQLRAALTTLK